MPPECHRKGLLAEIALEQRLTELGYGPICRPSRLDDGVDFVVFTAKGWLGIQVKTVEFRGERRRTRYELRLVRNSTKHDRTKAKSYYESRGVHVFAVFSKTGFYLVPITECAETGLGLGQAANRFWEAWQEVLGVPAQLVQQQARDEIQQIEIMWEGRS